MSSMGDWDDIIEGAEAECFVGREQELDIFRQHINRTPPRYLIFYICGQGGAGKSTLLKSFREIAKGFGFLLTDCDEQQQDVPAVLGRFAHQLAEQGHPLKRFDERYKVYRQKMHEIENDPEAPQGLAALLGRTVVRAAFLGGDLVPGVRKGLEYLPKESLETQVSQWATFLAKKLTNKDDVELIREPISVLTPLFFEDLNDLAKKRQVLLCFDNFEATRQGLLEWLLRLREYKPSQNIRIAIAGRDEPGAKWDALRKVTFPIHLDVFTEQEAEAFLDANSITDANHRREIVEYSGRLPVLMSWLSLSKGQEFDSTLPTHDIVERFLRWVTEPTLRQAASLAAIPRTFNLDIMGLLLSDANHSIDAQTAYDWLLTMPFVQQHSDSLRYHSVVRRMMLRYQKQKSPHTYQKMHGVLADFYNARRNEVSSSAGEELVNEQWRKSTLEYMYHFLATSPVQHWGEVVSLFAEAMRKRRAFATELIELLNSEDGKIDLSQEQNNLVQLFRQQLLAVENGELKDGFEMFNKLCALPGLSSQTKGYAYAFRGECYRLDNKWENALRDFGEALNYFPEDAWAIASRGQTYQSMERYEEALVDFDRAIALNEKYVWALGSRGQTYQSMKRYEEALADFDRAIALDEKYEWAIAVRGQTYRLMERYEEALADFDRAIALNEKDGWNFAQRGATYRSMERYEEALADFDRAIALNEKDAWAIAVRGETYRLMERYEEALADLDRAIALDKKYRWAITQRGATYRSTKRYEEALADFDRAIALDEKYEWAIAARGEMYRLMERYEEALADFDRAIALNEKDAWAIASRGQTYQSMERYEEALADFDRAIALNEKDAWAITVRGKTYRLMERYEEALADLDRAIALNEKYVWPITERGTTYWSMKRYEEALADFDRAIALGEKEAWAIAVRGATYRSTKRYEEALADFDRAIALDEKYEWAIAARGKTYRLMERYEEALADFDRAIALNEKSDWRRYERALLYLVTRQKEAFKRDIQTAIELAQTDLKEKPDDWRIKFNIALYSFVGRNANAKLQYEQLTSACLDLPRLRDAIEDLQDFLTIQQHNKQAQLILTRLEARISEIQSLPSN